jgi:hypothetical protein
MNSLANSVANSLGNTLVTSSITNSLANPHSVDRHSSIVDSIGTLHSSIAN